MKQQSAIALVTGGGGLIGSHLCSVLLDEGFEVICLDILPKDSTCLSEKVLENRAFQYVRHNVVNPFNIHCDVVFSLASRTDMQYIKQYPVETLKTDIIGCQNTLEVAKYNGADYILASSSDVYGISNASTYNESVTGIISGSSPKSALGSGKRAAEGFCEAYRNEFGVNAKVVRLFNTYGPEMNPQSGLIISKFIVSALQNTDLIIYGSGGQTRSFCWVEDTVDALMRIMRTRSMELSPVNIGSSHEITINALAKKILELTGSRSKILHINSPSDTRRHETPDITKARRILSWVPKTSLDEGLEKCIAYFDAELKYKKEVYVH